MEVTPIQRLWRSGLFTMAGTMLRGAAEASATGRAAASPVAAPGPNGASALAPRPTQWARLLDAEGLSQVAWNDIAVDPSGCILLAGCSGDPENDGRAIVRKHGAAGGQSWTSTSTGNGARSTAERIAVDRSGAVVVLGREALAGAPPTAFVEKLSPEGALLWSRPIKLEGQSDALRPSGLALDAEGHIFVALSERGRVALAKLDRKDGAVIWVDWLGATVEEVVLGAGVVVDAEGHVLVYGVCHPARVFARSLWVRKYKDRGVHASICWTRIYSEPPERAVEPWDMAVDSDGTVLVIGEERNGAKERRFLVKKLDPNGHMVWTKRHDAATSLNGLRRALLTGARADAIEELLDACLGTTASGVWKRKQCAADAGPAAGADDGLEPAGRGEARCPPSAPNARGEARRARRWAGAAPRDGLR